MPPPSLTPAPQEHSGLAPALSLTAARHPEPGSREGRWCRLPGPQRTRLTPAADALRSLDQLPCQLCLLRVSRFFLRGREGAAPDAVLYHADDIIPLIGVGTSIGRRTAPLVSALNGCKTG